MAADKSKVPAFDEMMNELLQAMKELGGSGTIREIDKKRLKYLNYLLRYWISCILRPLKQRSNIV